MGGRRVWAVMGGLLLIAGSAGVAGALPPPTPPGPPCSFALSAPVRTADAVVVTVESTGCVAAAVPYSTIACLQAPGAPIQCAQARGGDPASISVPYVGGSFIASGRGCAGWAGLPPAPFCQTLGPDAATL